MVLTYLRRADLLLPDYPNGLRSRIREGVVLDAISCENLSKQAIDQARFLESLIPVKTSASMETHCNRIIELLTAASCYSDLDRKKANSVLRSEARKTAAEVYEILKKYNYWDERPDFTPVQYREIINRINELKQKENGSRSSH